MRCQISYKFQAQLLLQKLYHNIFPQVYHSLDRKLTLISKIYCQCLLAHEKFPLSLSHTFWKFPWTSCQENTMFQLGHKWNSPIKVLSSVNNFPGIKPDVTSVLPQSFTAKDLIDADSRSMNSTIIFVFLRSKHSFIFSSISFFLFFSCFCFFQKIQQHRALQPFCFQNIIS